MVGHRTRLEQLPVGDWHKDEDAALARAMAAPKARKRVADDGGSGAPGGKAHGAGGTLDFIQGIIPTSLLSSLTAGNILQTLFVALLVGSALLLLTSGCSSPSPEDVCKHMETLKAGAGSGMCSFKMMEMKELHRDQYKQLAPCIMEAKDVDGFNACIQKFQK